MLARLARRVSAAETAAATRNCGHASGPRPGSWPPVPAVPRHGRKGYSHASGPNARSRTDSTRRDWLRATAAPAAPAGSAPAGAVRSYRKRSCLKRAGPEPSCPRLRAAARLRAIDLTNPACAAAARSRRPHCVPSRSPNATRHGRAHRAAPRRLACPHPDGYCPISPIACTTIDRLYRSHKIAQDGAGGGWIL